MKKIIIIAAIATISTSIFASAPTSSVNKSAQPISSLSKTWKIYRSLQPNNRKNEVGMVYGGEDIKSPSAAQTVQS